MYSVSFGVGKGLMYSSVLNAAISHLPGRKGTVSGCVICGLGWGGFFFGILTNRLCNPDDIRPILTETTDGFENLFPIEVAMRVPAMWRSLGLVWACLFAFGLITITEYKHSETKTEEKQQELDLEATIPLQRILTTKQFIMLYVLAASHMFEAYYVGNSFKMIGYKGGIKDSTLTIIGSTGSLLSGCSKIIFASLLDYFPFKKVYGGIITMIIVSLVMLHFTQSSPIGFGLCFCTAYMCGGSMTSMLPAITL
jgi:Na+/melibiose symporter-like transporter